jgi:hypothetical protein
MPQFKVTIPDRASCGCGESFVAWTGPIPGVTPQYKEIRWQILQV